MRLHIISGVEDYPTEWKEGDVIPLDGASDPTLAGKVPALGSDGQTGVSASTGFSVPATRRNLRALAGKLLPGRVRTIPGIRAFLHGQALPFQSIFVTDYSEGSETINLAFGDSGSWESAAGALTLNNVEGLPEINITIARQTGTWAKTKYADIDDGICFPFINYGQGSSGYWNYLDPGYFRAWINVLWLCRKIFCTLGYVFECPYLESDVGRRWWCYILRDQYLAPSQAEAQIGFFNATLKQTEVDSNYTRMFFTEEVSDPSGQYQGTRGAWHKSGTYDFYARIEGEILAGDGSATLYIQSGARLNGAIVAEDAVLGSASITPGGTGAFTLEVKVEAYQVFLGDFVQAYVHRKGAANVKITSSTFSCKMIRKGTGIGDTIDLSQEVRDDTAMQFLKGVQHALAGRWHQKGRKVTLYTPLDHTPPNAGAPLEGFYIQDEQEDLNGRINPGSRTITNAQDQQQRYIKLGFKQTTDPKLSKLGIDNLHGRVVDLGEGLVEETVPELNPYFEPSLEEQITSNFSLTPWPIHTLSLADNTDGAVSYSIGPRIALLYQGPQNVPTADGVKVPYLKLADGSIYDNFAFATHRHSQGYTVAAPAGESLVYGEVAKDLYDAGWLYELVLRSSARAYQVTVNGDTKDWLEFDYRAKYLMNVFGYGLPFRLFEKSLDPSGVITLLLRLDQIAILGCDVLGTGSPVIGFREVALVDASGNSTVATAVAKNDLITTAIDSEVWEVSTDGGGTFSLYTPGASVSNTALTVFRRTVTLTNGVTLPPAVGYWRGEIDCTHTLNISAGSDGGFAFAVADDGALSPTVDTDTWEYRVDGGSWGSYTPGDMLGDVGLIEFRRTVVFVGACNDVVLEAVVNNAVTPCDNSGTAIQLTEVGACYFTPGITGNTSEIHAVYWYLNWPDEAGAFKPWDGMAFFRKDGLIVRAVVFFKGGCKPIQIEYTCES